MFCNTFCRMLLCSILLAAAVWSSPGQAGNTMAFSAAAIRKGATGDDVIELQARLQYIGFYSGKIDGAFGWSTYWALRNFQSKFGLPVDGVAGATTKQKLTNASKYDAAWVKGQIRQGNDFTYYGGRSLASQVKGKGGGSAPAKQASPSQSVKPTAANVPNGFSQSDLQLLARAVYGEARGEPYEGQVAIAAVILNRISSPSFPNTIAGVIYEPLAFTCVADGQINLTPNDSARKAVTDAMNGWDPSQGATYYFNPATATSKWIWSRPQIKKIGKHIFCK
ncbi:spore cortex-lytic enzyme [Ectobacillus ponti]|uniref:Spore cortex-lytic enzyme n=1 Tax=Ectobacillus ponti TaxID=2961894 RepID=A0AA42BUR3_9BACI|nr:spore cortex-lytic enzyme [Ectobacillus ponti]MCP8970783.1 spore cortex-lytic enzyme [Ectobacillus ponti]